ncbi:MAG: permease-like cell division protein FtsX [Patescibacteria group bacterium]
MVNIRVLKNAVRNLWRNKWLTVATVTVMTLTLFTVAMFMVINVLLSSTIDEVKSRIDLEVFFKTAVTQDQVMAVKNDMEKNTDVKSVKYISKSDALATFKDRNAQDPTVFETITDSENPLPQSLKITLFQVEKLESLNTLFKGGRYGDIVQKTSYEDNRKTIDGFINFGKSVRAIGLALSLIFLLTSLIVVFNTIRINIYTRKDEIEIMKLVGATNWYIRWPFILEGACYGLISLVISTVVLLIGLHFINPYLALYLGDFRGRFYDYLGLYTISIIGIQLLISVVLGVVSSLFAMTRYLKI